MRRTVETSKMRNLQEQASLAASAEDANKENILPVPASWRKSLRPPREVVAQGRPLRHKRVDTSEVGNTTPLRTRDVNRK